MGQTIVASPFLFDRAEFVLTFFLTFANPFLPALVVKRGQTMNTGFLIEED
jgi:hypothetical protein